MTDFKTSSLLSGATAKYDGSAQTAPTNVKTGEQLDAAQTKEKNQASTLSTLTVNTNIGKPTTVNTNIRKPTISNKIKPITASRVPKQAEAIAITPAVIQQANMEFSNGSMAQALNTLRSAEQEAVLSQGSTETKGEPSWTKEPEYDDYDDDDYDDDEPETTDDKPSNLKWWLIGGIGGGVLLIAIVVIIIVAMRKRK